MSCECAKCREHYKTLGFMFGIPSETEIQEAYKEGVKQWHPDLYENYASLRADAEEHFKQIQVAYRELTEHNATPADLPVERIVVQRPTNVEQPRVETAAISFGDAPGCLTAKRLTKDIEEMIAPHLGKLGLAVAIVDISGKRSNTGGFSQFLLLASRGIMMRDSRNMISVLWYTDLGEVKLIVPHEQGKSSGWAKFMGGLAGPASSELQIYRSNGVLFQSLSGQVDDGVKTGIYNFLMTQKEQARP